MKNFVLILILLTGLSFSGCTPSGTIPGVSVATNAQYSSYGVVGAEKALRASKDTIDLFLKLEHDNPELAKIAHVHTFAEKCRKEVPDLLIRANDLKNTYKHNRTADNQTALSTVMATLQTFASQASNYTELAK